MLRKLCDVAIYTLFRKTAIIVKITSSFAVINNISIILVFHLIKLLNIYRNKLKFVNSK